jgi:uncharacterized protein with von Willebrand factor type A (vWA) domain
MTFTEAMQAPGALLSERIYNEYARNGTEPDGREEELIERACQTAELIAQLEEVVAQEGTMSTGSAGQRIVHPAVPEIRQQRALLMRLLGQLNFGDTSSSISAGARHAANVRWNKGARGSWIGK